MSVILDEAAARAGAAVLRRHFEGFRATPYRDQRGIWTIGEGLTRLNGQPVTASTLPITPIQSDAATAFEFDRSVALIQRHVTAALSARQAAALIDLVFNVGPAPLLPGHTLYATLARRDWTAAADAFLAWDLAGGHVDRGLVCRRQVERLVFRAELDPTDLHAIEAAHAAALRALDAPRARPAAPAPALSTEALNDAEAASLGL